MTPSAPRLISKLAALRDTTAAWRANGESLALVPTMGALHAGHLALVEAAKSAADHTVVSVFVNPSQFAPGEDLATYPRDMAADAAILKAAGVDLIWAPEAAQMYPPEFATQVTPKGAADGLEAVRRPHFFGGVTTVCLKLFNQVQPEFATFGEKDYQQLCVIRQLVRDFDLPMQILPVPTVRETDGLAMSSRNAYLSETERAAAPALHRELQFVAEAVSAGTDPATATAAAKDALSAVGFGPIDYVEVRDAVTLAEPQLAAGTPARVLAAAFLGTTRLIDNVPVPGPVAMSQPVAE